MKVGIINVGVNASHGSLMSPIFEDGTFEFVPIPCCSPTECPNEIGNCSDCIEQYSIFPKYKSLNLQHKKPSEFIPSQLLEMRTHNDPEFDTFTYGDFPSKNPRASNLKKLVPGDRLFFLVRLVDWRDGNFTFRAGFYLVGFLEIEHVFEENELIDIVEHRKFDDRFKKMERNAHVLMAEMSPEFWLEDVCGWRGSWVFLGSKKSQRFTYAVPFNRALADEIMLDAYGNKWTWPENQTELQRIGSYTRSCRIIEDEARIKKLFNVIRQYDNPIS